MTHTERTGRNQLGLLEPHAATPDAAPQGGDGWGTPLTVDRSDTFFYDHPLDHVPGMLLVCKVADAVRDRTAIPPDSRAKWVVNFRVMPELSPSLTLIADPEAGGRRQLRVVQGTTVVSDGWFELSSDAACATAGLRGPARRDPARANLVHRMRPENIMIGEPLVDDELLTAPVQIPATRHTLASRRPGFRSVKSVIEAGRQLATWLSHRVGGWPLDTQMLWVRLTADLPLELPAALPLSLHWQPVRVPEDKARLKFDVVAGDGSGVRVGSLIYTSKGLRPESYAGFRANRSAA